MPKPEAVLAFVENDTGTASSPVLKTAVISKRTFNGSSSFGAQCTCQPGQPVPQWNIDNCWKVSWDIRLKKVCPQQGPNACP